MQLRATRPLVQSLRELQYKAHANANLHGVALSHYDRQLNQDTTLLILVARVTIQVVQLIHCSGCSKIGWKLLVAQLGY